MTMSDGTAIDWDALLKWYLSADQLIHSLDACCIIVEAMPDGDAPANLAAAEMLSRREIGRRIAVGHRLDNDAAGIEGVNELVCAQIPLEQGIPINGRPIAHGHAS